MKMTSAYLRETSDFLVDRGFSRHISRQTTDEHEICRYRMVRADQQFVLESVDYRDGETRYFFEIIKLGPLRSHSLELDSWKHKGSVVELRYLEARDVTTGVTLFLDL